MTCAPHVIILCHIKIDRYTKDDTGKSVLSQHIALSSGIARRVLQDLDALGSMNRKKKQGFISFKAPTNDLDAGTRTNYLDGENILISEEIDGVIVTYWEKIYRDYEKRS